MGLTTVLAFNDRMCAKLLAQGSGLSQHSAKATEVVLPLEEVRDCAGHERGF